MVASVGGVISGGNPFVYDSSSPLTLFLFQACLILAVCNLVHIPFSKIRQPKVISEVIGGVILGPTVFGQIPGYTKTVFPAASIPGLTLTANLGIILFMFFLGLEVDIAFIKNHLFTALSIGISTLAIPFGCGCLFAIPLYNNYANLGDSGTNVKFTVFMVFIATSLSVTAFPVLCRILNELRLIKERAGIIVLGAGIINDILGWILLALSVVLSSSQSSPVNTVYILLCVFGWFLVYFYPLKYILKWALIKTHELDRSKPSTLATMCVLFIMFISAYFTDIVGVHPIFGAFIAGLVVPRENNYVIKLTERMEDIPNIVLIPIYFAVSGLNVDLTLLNEGKDWGFVFASIGIAICSKIIPGTLVAKTHRLFWRESLVVGVLMSCKGIVEIVVLTVGLGAGIITKKIYGMFILMALVSTIVTTPLSQLVYPTSYRSKLQKLIGQENSEDLGDKSSEIIESIQNSQNSLNTFNSLKSFSITEIVNIINTTENIPPSLELLNSLLYGKCQSHSFVEQRTLRSEPSFSNAKSSSNKLKKLARKWSNTSDESIGALTVIEEDANTLDVTIPLRAIHLRLLTERTTDLLQSSSLSNTDHHFTANSDSLLQIYDIFSRLVNVPFRSEVIFSTIRDKATDMLSFKLKNTDLLLLPLKGASYEYHGPLILRDEKYTSFDHIHSHLLSLNELPSNFFSSLTNLKSNLAILISNTSDRQTVDRYKKKVFNLLLPNPNLASSDFLALYILLLIAARDQKNMICGTVFVNEKITDLADRLHQVFPNQDLIGNSKINIQAVSLTGLNSEKDIVHSSFIESILSKRLSDEAIENLEETTFIVPEPSFSPFQPFSKDVKEIVLQGSNQRFNVLVVHHYTDSHLKSAIMTDN
ncbi:hypothetical protein KAFR_0A01430 [Kazachstania africana CBS 2517]|uniref:Cation/H+ exchanger transmembrane domain-containing protein n=1 Tax=Kazachstania africana (strain ATCC 22294 / BCRC 22015 / CBS 2517 / CECT 1963 / NBRC 1671 / NRRL Y-8276) TaxID=1071382 RepID=H2AMI1_KAZAF|nr:hypothetical protein KAFR_0A01430 [Kazachstania africana CBS 2517]CCF55581.1 hypothetical protein KAFR_0A01430 [Kazachstania africana CBS 2517]